MKEHFINPTNPEEIVKELFNENPEIVDEFSKRFSKEILEFAELFSAAYKKYLELNRLLIGSENKQKAYVGGFTYLMCDNLLTSVKLFIMGYETPSGNLMRQVIESVALAILCSLKDDIKIRKKRGKLKNIHFYTSFIENKSEAKSHKAIQHLELNYQKLGIQKDAINALQKARKFFHNFSHPSQLSLATTISFDDPPKTFIGGSFDSGKIENYKKELMHRASFCRVLPNIIEGLIARVKELP